MFMSYQHPSFFGRLQRAAEEPVTPAPPEAAAVYRPARRYSERACCCNTAPAVAAVIPASGDRLEPTDLLLCGHHYRKSMRALAAIGAIVLSLDGYPLPLGNWPKSG
jgi:hypothetical protein